MVFYLNGEPISDVVSPFPVYALISDTEQKTVDDSVFRLWESTPSLDWKWNESAILSMALLGHTAKEDTLHADIRRLPANDHGAGIPNLENYQREVSDGVETALNILIDSIRRAIEGETEAPVISLSAGYDSRLLLAICLNLGIEPIAQTIDAPDSVDFQMARHMAKSLSLEFVPVPISSEQYLEHGCEISRETSGVKTFADWHTWLYGHNSSLRGRLHLVGSNGELARNFYFDPYNRIGNYVASKLPSSAAASFLRLKSSVRLRKYRVLRKYLLPRIPRLYAPTRIPDSAIMSSANGMFSGLERFYTLERVRHFIGAGLVCYARFGRPFSPFLHPGWIYYVSRLPWQQKSQSWFHRHAIDRLNPFLASLPFNPSSFNGASGSFNKVSQVIKSDQLHELLQTNDKLFELFCLPRGSDGLLRRATFADLNLLSTIYFAMENVRNQTLGSRLSKQEH
jgi:hypothetical protein